MSKSGWRNWLGAAAIGLAAWAPAQAGVVDFEDVAPDIFSGTAITSGGFVFQSDAFGFSAITDAPSFAFGNAPGNSTGQFLAMLNGDGMIMSPGGGVGLMTLDSFDLSFIAPLQNIGAGFIPGELFVLAIDSGGFLLSQTIVFPAADGAGNFSFTNVGAGALGGGLSLQAIGFFACVYNAGGGCDFSADAQFALDNIRADLPEPATWALGLLALGMVATSRRKSA